MKTRIHKLQIARRTVQFAVLALVLAIPAVARYNNYLAARELDKRLDRWSGTFRGNVLGTIDGLFRALPGGEKERADRRVRDRKRVMLYAQQFRGGPWSAQFAGLSLTDPLAAAESVASSRRLSRVLLASLLVPILATFVLGRIFCSWICPVGLLLELSDKLRGVLRFLELPPRDLAFSRATRFVLLAVGLGMAAVISVPVLNYVYPPAILNRELHDLVFSVFDRAELGRAGWWIDGLTWMSLLLLGIMVFEVTLSRRWWCRYLCPGGAMYTLLGRARLVRVKCTMEKCTGCNDCVPVCPVGINPVRESAGPDCDNCGECISHCNDGALNYGLHLKPLRKSGASRLLLFLAFFAALPGVAGAHHILGIPHYAYDEQYPQTPILTYLANAGPYEVRMTGYPGKPEPGERCTMHVYFQAAGAGDAATTVSWPEKVTMTVLRDRLIGDDPITYGPVAAEREEAMYKFYPRFETEANYVVRIGFEAEDAPWIIDLPMVVGDPGSPWLVLGGSAGGLVLFLIAIRAARIKTRRRTTARVSEANPQKDRLPPVEGFES